MLRDRRFLTGLGAGLMIGAMLLQLMTAFGSGPAETVDDALRREETPADPDRLAEEARRLGLVLHDASKTWLTREEADAMVREAVDRAREEAPAAGGRTGGVEAVGPDELPHYYLVEIRAGMTSDEVGSMLHAAGLVDDLDEWRREMDARGLTIRIRAGTYAFAYKPDLAELIDAVTLKTGGR